MIGNSSCRVLNASVVRIDCIDVKGRTLTLLTLDVSYLDAIRFAEPNLIVRITLSDREKWEGKASLEMTQPLDAPACIAVAMDESVAAAIDNRVELIRSDPS